MKEPDVKRPAVHVLAGRGRKPWIPAFAGMTSLLFFAGMTSLFFAGMTSLFFAGMTSLLFGAMTSLFFGRTTALFFAAMTSLFRHARGGGHPGLPEFHAARMPRSAMDH